MLGSSNIMANEIDTVPAIMEFTCRGGRVKYEIHANIITTIAVSVMKETSHELRWRITGQSRRASLRGNT